MAQLLGWALRTMTRPLFAVDTLDTSDATATSSWPPTATHMGTEMSTGDEVGAAVTSRPPLPTVTRQAAAAPVPVSCNELPPVARNGGIQHAVARHH